MSKDEAKMRSNRRNKGARKEQRRCWTELVDIAVNGLPPEKQGDESE